MGITRKTRGARGANRLAEAKRLQMEHRKHIVARELCKLTPKGTIAKELGVSQPRVVKLESGEHNPEIDTIINAVRRLGIEFVLDVAPAARKPTLVTAQAQKGGAIDHDEVSVVAASA